MATTFRSQLRVLNLPRDKFWRLQYDRGTQPVILAECLPSDEAMAMANSANSFPTTPTVYAVEVEIRPLEGGRVIRPCHRPRSKGGAA